MVSLMREIGVNQVRVDQCMYGLVTNKGENSGPAMKPTGIMSNSKEILQHVELRCDGKHTHSPLIGGKHITGPAAH